MKLIVQEQAASDIETIYAWIATDKPGAARRMVETIERRILDLLEPGMSHMGRSGRQPGTRELVVPPYIIVY